MPSFLILRLQGPMQAWGKHTFETFRPSELFPTRSGLVGLLAACLGVDREARDDMKALSESFRFAVRVDEVRHAARRITDFHTIKKARGVQPGKWKEQEVSKREYLCDARFTAALEFFPDACYGADRVVVALRRPRFTPFLGRRSCPLGRPLLDEDIKPDSMIEAEDLHAALASVPPQAGTIYSEIGCKGGSHLTVRDVPLFRQERQFGVRPVFIHAREIQGEAVSEQS